MSVHQNFPLFGIEELSIHFVENEGMAFGMKLGEHSIWKLVLSLFRTVAIIGIIWYLRFLAKLQAPKVTLWATSLILAGAAGNMIDSAFYGMLFSESGIGKVAEFLPESGGYESFMYGHVVDMFSFVFFTAQYPDWVPFGLGGSQFKFFGPIFNFADACITSGVFLVLFFRKKFIFEIPPKETETETEEEIEFINPKDPAE